MMLYVQCVYNHNHHHAAQVARGDTTTCASGLSALVAE